MKNMYNNDNRTVITLDAGGTNFVFGAIRGGEYIISPISYPSNSQNIDMCLETMVKGFSEVISFIQETPVAISFAFPGPADYVHGIIGGNLPNFSSFRNGVALKPFLEKKFELPVFINNDGHLYAYGEAMGGALPQLNSHLENMGYDKKYHNLIGVTLGTGFGCGIVIDGKLLSGDNGVGSGLWCLRDYLHPELIVEESVSTRAIKRVYAEKSNDTRKLTPKDIFDIAEGRMEGDRNAALKSFVSLGHIAGDALATVSSLIDGIIVIGGGITGASKYFMPSLLKQMTSKLSMTDGSTFSRMQAEVFLLSDAKSFENFTSTTLKPIQIYQSDKTIMYEYIKKIPIMISNIGANKAIALGAYFYALNNI